MIVLGAISDGETCEHATSMKCCINFLESQLTLRDNLEDNMVVDVWIYRINEDTDGNG